MCMIKNTKLFTCQANCKVKKNRILDYFRLFYYFYMTKQTFFGNIELQWLST